MWNLSFTPPATIEARVWTRLPDAYRQTGRSDWVDTSRPGLRVHNALQGLAFNAAGDLFVADLAQGRIFRLPAAAVVDSTLDEPGALAWAWELVCVYEGWPSALAVHANGTLWIADQRHGLLTLNTQRGHVERVLVEGQHPPFKALSSLSFDTAGVLYFCDAAQGSLHGPCGGVYRLWPSGQLDGLLNAVPGPQGLALNGAGNTLFVSAGPANALWRAALLPDRGVSQASQFHTFFGHPGPAALALDVEQRVVVAHAGMGCAWVLNERGELTHRVQCPSGSVITGLTFKPKTRELVLTDSATGSLLTATMPAPGLQLFSHQ